MKPAGDSPTARSSASPSRISWSTCSGGAAGELGAVAPVGARVRPAVEHDLVAAPGPLARPAGRRPGPPRVPPAVARHQQQARRPADRLRHQLVAPLPEPEQEQAALQVVRRQVAADPVQRVGQRVRHPRVCHVVHQLVEVLPQPGHVGPAGLVEAPGEHVHGHPVLGELGGHLHADQHVGVVSDLERPRDGVVVRQRHQVHAAPLGRRVGGLGLGERLGHHRLGEEPAPRVGRRPRVQVEVDPALVCGPAGCGGTHVGAERGMGGGVRGYTSVGTA
jgi:hypothetical protein